MDTQFTDPTLNEDISGTKRAFSKIQKISFLILKALSYGPYFYFHPVIPLTLQLCFHNH